MTDLVQLVIELTRTNVLANDAETALYALEGLQELENQGWKFISPSADESPKNRVVVYPWDQAGPKPITESPMKVTH